MLDVQVTRDEIHFGASLTVHFAASLQAFEDPLEHTHAVGIRSFPIYRISECGDRLPVSWGGVLLPLSQDESLQICFSARWWKPNAVKVGIGDSDALSGGIWNEELTPDPQNYIVCPVQDSLDGLGLGDGSGRQATAIKPAYTAAEPDAAGWYQRLRLVVYEPRPGLFPDRPPRARRPDELKMRGNSHLDTHRLTLAGKSPSQIRLDPYGIATWDQDDCRSIDVYLVDQTKFRILTGI
ncbi:MAG: hypothetical protein QUV05_03025 [Phycisphaerae bacterium]|nr:hypothetical protein [Phycisphaerae bacterium]